MPWESQTAEQILAEQLFHADAMILRIILWNGNYFKLFFQ